jgi:hypothetical protein
MACLFPSQRKLVSAVEQLHQLPLLLSQHSAEGRLSRVA